MGVRCEHVFTELSAGEYQTCGLRDDGKILCWGQDDVDQASPPALSFRALSEGEKHGCGVVNDGTLACWGYGFFTVPTDGGYVGVSSHGDHSCATHANGSVTCWGDTSGGKAMSPPEAFASVAVGNWHTCGLRASDRTVACWGLDDGFMDFGQADAPFAASLLALDVNDDTSCGVDTLGELVCWGSGFGGSLLPAGPFVTLALGASFGCAIRTNGDVACWGDDGFGQAAPPSGAFTKIAAGDHHACALAASGAVTCWGFSGLGQTTPPRNGE